MKNFIQMAVVAIILTFTYNAALSAQQLPEKSFTDLSEKLGFQVGEKDSTHFHLYKTAVDWLGVKYKWGGNTRNSGVDCSGFTGAMYDLLYNKALDHSSSSLAKTVPIKLTSPDKLKPGDMVFFATSKKHGNINHVGIYLRDGFFVHASSAKGRVIISTLLEGFYKKAWRLGGRLNQ